MMDLVTEINTDDLNLVVLKVREYNNGISTSDLIDEFKVEEGFDAEKVRELVRASFQKGVLILGDRMRLYAA